jgi:hypothetical protein
MLHASYELGPRRQTQAATGSRQQQQRAAASRSESVIMQMSVMSDVMSSAKAMAKANTNTAATHPEAFFEEIAISSVTKSLVCFD